MLLRPKIPRAPLPTNMPFGKHRGKSFKDIPSNYMRWLQEQDFVHQTLQEAILQEMTRRDRDDCHWEE